jgi:hypothetical protein
MLLAMVCALPYIAGVSVFLPWAETGRLAPALQHSRKDSRAPDRMRY